MIEDHDCDHVEHAIVVWAGSRSLHDWWAVNAPSRHRLVFRLARHIHAADGANLAALDDPEVKKRGGIPLALAYYRLAWRARRHKLARNSRLAERSDWKIWHEWCVAHGYPRFNPSVQQVERFVREKAPHYKLSSLRRLYASIRMRHRVAGQPDPMANLLLKGIWKGSLKVPTDSKGKPLPASQDRRVLRRKQAAPVRIEPVLALMAALNKENTLSAVRDAALIGVGWCTLARSEELVSIRKRDVTKNEDGCTIWIRRAKNDQAGEGRECWIRPDVEHALWRWFAASGLDAVQPKEDDDDSVDLIFRSLKPRRDATSVLKRPALQSTELLRILRRRYKQAGLLEAKPSGHSMRVGAAQDLAAAGINIGDIARAGGWGGVEMVLKYTERLGAAEGAIKQHHAKTNKS